jgi:hypothetical protein
VLKLFFADAQHPADARALLADVKRRSTERVAALRAIETSALAAAEEGNRYPLLTLQMGIAFHQAMIDSCADFERNADPSPLP